MVTGFSENRTERREVAAVGAALISKELSRLTSVPPAMTSASSGFNKESRRLRRAMDDAAAPPFFCTPRMAEVVVHEVLEDSFNDEAPRGLVSTDNFKESKPELKLSQLHYRITSALAADFRFNCNITREH